VKRGGGVTPPLPIYVHVFNDDIFTFNILYAQKMPRIFYVEFAVRTECRGAAVCPAPAGSLSRLPSGRRSTQVKTL
jgi:hypothetical protein